MGGRLAVLAPAGLLVAVVLVAGGPGLLTPGGSAAGTPMPNAPAGGLPGDAPQGGQPGTDAAPGSQPGGAAVPVYAWDLPVRSVPELLAARASGSVRGGLVAVAGLLGQDPAAVPCDGPDPGLTAVFCHRTALLTATPEPGSTSESSLPGPATPPASGPTPRSRTGPHLHPRIASGIPMPSVFQLDPRAPDEGGPVMPSIVIGRFAQPEPPTCPPDGGRCRDEFLLERLAWAEGGWIDLLLVRDPELPPDVLPATGRRPLAIAARELDRMEQILSMAVLHPDWLARVDQPAAAEAAAGAENAGIGMVGPVWYLRSVGRRWPGLDRALTWAVIDHLTGLVLAGGVIGPG